MKKVLFLAVTLMCTLSYVSVLAYQKDAGAQEKTGQTASTKQARWDGMVQAANKDNRTLMVRNVGRSLVKTIHYDDSTKFVSQEHGSKKVNDIDPTQVKEGDRVICLGREDKKGFHATLVSKRLTVH